MNREIKFRGKDVFTKAWRYSDLVHNQKVTITGLEPRTMVGGYEVKPEMVSMNTGLKDKNGHEIYDGDILAHNGRVIGHVVDGVRGYCLDVAYADQVSTSTWSLYGVVVNDYDMKATWRLLETYDNPEVVKGGTQCVPDKQEK